MLDIILRYCHGFSCLPVITACKNRGLFNILETEGPKDITSLTEAFHANSGHLQVALRQLHSLGLLHCDEYGNYSLTEAASLTQAIPRNLTQVYTLDFFTWIKSKSSYLTLKKWQTSIANRWEISDERFADFLTGVVMLPLLLTLKNKYYFDNYKYVDFKGLPNKNRDALFDLLASLGYGHCEDTHFILNQTGKFITDRILTAGVTVSYAPMLSQIDEVIFGDPRKVFIRDVAGHEAHVNRTLNVIGSGFQHERYFADIDTMIIDIFNRKPLASQPKYVADMGCGDGTLLKRIYNVIQNKTNRGKELDNYPVILLGIDYNDESLEVTDENLGNLPHQVIHGDIGDPEKMEADLVEAGIKDTENILHVRSFLDHDRPYISPSNTDAVKNWERILYPGVFVDGEGNLIEGNKAQQSLVEHLERWGNIKSRHGIVILEVHSLPADVVYNNLDRSENFHFDALQAFSMQHLNSARAFVFAAVQAGLYPDLKYFKRYPKTFPFTRITLNLYKTEPFKLRHARHSDLPDLEILEKKCWPDGMQLSRTVLSQRLDNYPEGQVVLEMKGKVVGVVYTQRIASVRKLQQSSFDKLSTLHEEKGPVLQLLSLNMLPEKQGLELGDKLLNFMLRYATLDASINRITGVTRCLNFLKQTELSMEQYVAQRDADGFIIDPIPRFHMKHGATIKNLIKDYRPEDKDNQGYGLLIEYDLQQFKTGEKRHKKITKVKKGKKLTKELIEEITKDKIAQILSSKQMEKFTMNTPLMDLGFDSLGLLELRTLLIEEFHQVLHATFFFQYGTPQAIVDYFVEIKLYSYKDWLYDVQWSETPTPLENFRNLPKNGVWLILIDEGNFGKELATKLTAYGQNVLIARYGAYYNRLDENNFTIRNNEEDFNRLLHEDICQQRIDGIVYLWGLFNKISEEPSLYSLNT